MADPPDADSTEGTFDVVVISRTGKVLLHEQHKRTNSLFLDTSSDPNALGVFIHEGNNRGIVRVSDSDLNQGNEEWWKYDLVSARRLPRLTPKLNIPSRHRGGTILDSVEIRGTPLTLMHWWLYEGNQMGGSIYRG